jgi:tetratricopeptide (TPR) repeat protein
LKKALALKPTATFAIRLLADTYADRGSEEDALATYDRGLKLDPENATLHNHKGVFLINRLHQPTAALRAFEEAIRLQPGVWNFRRNQSVALWSMGQPEKAIQSIDEALPRLEHKHAAYYQKGEIRLGQGRWAEAIASYRSARKEAPQWIDPCRALQHTYFQTGRYRDGVEISREAIRLAPDDLFVRMMLVCFLCASGEEEEAVRRAKLWCAGAIPTNRTMDFAYLCAIAGEAEKAREALARIAHPDAETRIFIAAIQARLGDVDAAVASVKAAAEQGYRIKEGAVLPPELEALPPDRVGDWFRRMRER